MRERLQRGRGDYRDIVGSRADADDFLRVNVEQRLDELTIGDPELVEAIRAGELDGHKMTKNGTLNPKFVAAVEERHARLPESVVGRRTTSGDTDGAFRQTIDRMFETLMTTPSNKFDRSPLFRQQYWRSMERLAGNVDPKAAERLAKNLDAANLKPAQARRIRERLQRKPKVGNDRILTPDEAD